MGNRRRSDILDTMIDTIILAGPIKRTDIPKETGLSIKTVNEWLEMILRIQSIPALVVEGEGRKMVISLDAPKPEEARLESAMAFFNQVVEVSKEQEAKPEVGSQAHVELAAREAFDEEVAREAKPSEESED